MFQWLRWCGLLETTYKQLCPFLKALVEADLRLWQSLSNLGIVGYKLYNHWMSKRPFRCQDIFDQLNEFFAWLTYRIPCCTTIVMPTSIFWKRFATFLNGQVSKVIKMCILEKICPTFYTRGVKGYGQILCKKHEIYSFVPVSPTNRECGDTRVQRSWDIAVKVSWSILWFYVHIRIFC